MLVMTKMKLVLVRYDGPCLIELVDSLEPPPRLVARPLRLVIAEVMRTRTLGPSAFGGKLESGAIQSGTKVSGFFTLYICPVSHADL